MLKKASRRRFFLRPHGRLGGFLTEIYKARGWIREARTRSGQLYYVLTEMGLKFESEMSRPGHE